MLIYQLNIYKVNRLKIEIYKKLRKVETEEQLFDVKDELIDRFNDYPIEVERLLDIVEIKVHALHAGVELIKRQRQIYTNHFIT